MRTLHGISYVLVWAGALNWGLIGLFGFNLVARVFGSLPGLEKIVYVAVGAAAVYLIAVHKEYCKYCGEAKK